MVLLINYADGKFLQSQKENSESGMRMGFNSVLSFHRSDLDKEFVREYEHILKYERGAGYWIWKPYLILKTLNKVSKNDIVFYCDSGATFTGPISSVIDLFKDECEEGIMGFALTHPEFKWTKRDAFILMGCDSPRYAETSQRLAGYSIWKKTNTSVEFLTDWLRYGKDERIITDIPSETSNYDGFVEHRHDQSIYSLLSKKYGLYVYRDPSQYGEGTEFSTFINSHRNPH